MKAFIDNSKMFSDKEKEDDDLFNIVIAIKGQVFEIDQDYAITCRANGIHAIGSGADYALGAMMAGASGQQAMSIAAALDVNTSEPFITLHQHK